MSAEAAPETCELVLEPEDNQRLASLCGQFDENLREVERRLGVELNNRGNVFRIIGPEASVESARRALLRLYADTEAGTLTAARVHLLLQAEDDGASTVNAGADEVAPERGARISTRSGAIVPRGANQRRYVENIRSCDINFGIGPAGTGKTYLAVACAVEALEREQVRRILLVRPAVEAGERLGFLPGDLAQKIDPYLRPLYDALYEMLGFDRVSKLIERNVIEVAPLAYMRGRTLNESFIILDEAQNTTTEQMKMFLTRIGFGSTVVVTGDITQVDLPRDKESGLRHVIEILKHIEGISFVFFQSRDVVRHPLVQRIVAAYEQAELTKGGGRDGARSGRKGGGNPS
ncbi:MAG: PhoH family protein [Gammaproteobacteria bacterium]|jgi:phosphate starvation-inducible PhoH-like protein|nr:PhoH family protein [Gammaproteobacteria bacterium]